MALDSNPLITNCGFEMGNKLIEYLIALGLDCGFAGFKPNLLHEVTKTDSSFASSILYLKLAWGESLRRSE